MNITDISQDVLTDAAMARLVEAATASAAHVSPSRLRSPRRGTRSDARTRQTAMYLAHVAFGLSFTRVGICFGRDRTTVRHACAVIEDRRDDAGHDLALAALEAGLQALGLRLIGDLAGEGRP